MFPLKCACTPSIASCISNPHVVVVVVSPIASPSILLVQILPPTRSLASSTVTATDVSSASLVAAANPAAPAPTTHTDTDEEDMVQAG